MIDLDAARRFLALHGRLLERVRFAYLFDGAPAQSVVRALAGYANDDGGFGQALEPDVRTPTSQPIAVLAAFEVLDEVGDRDNPLALAALDWLAGAGNADGGVPFMRPDARNGPHAPFFGPVDDPPSSFHMTSAVTGTALRLAAHSASVRGHPWLEGAVAFCWAELPRVLERGAQAYEIKFALEFLDAVQDRARAHAALEELRAIVPADRPLPVAGGTSDEALSLTVLTPWPDRPSRGIFDPAAVERALDDVAGAQREDGGWEFDWLAWNPAVAWESRGSLTVHNLAVLRANGRLTP